MLNKTVVSNMEHQEIKEKLYTDALLCCFPFALLTSAVGEVCNMKELVVKGAGVYLFTLWLNDSGMMR